MIAIIRSVLAVVLGYATIFVGATVFQELLFGGISYLESPPPDLFIGGGLTALSAVAGGYLLAVIAPARPLLHVIPLVMWLCFETTYLYVTGISAGPLWFDAVSGASLVAGVLVGAIVYLRLGSTASPRPELKPSSD